MIRTQIQLTPEQARSLKQLAAREGKSVAELIRLSLDEMLKSHVVRDDQRIRRKALEAAGKLSGPADLAENHDAHLAEALQP